jgi:hypothetical protein
MTVYTTNVLLTLLLVIVKVVCLLVAIAYFTLAERKIMAAVQRRVGPNVVGPFGLLQPLADGLKLAGKELAVPAQASSKIFLSVAMSVLLFALSGWTAIPFGLFDHSEHMSTKSVVASLYVTTEPPAVADVCVECQLDADEMDDAESDLTEEGRAWVIREVSRWMAELNYNPVTQDEKDIYTGHVLLLMQELTKFAIEHHAANAGKEAVVVSHAAALALLVANTAQTAVVAARDDSEEPNGPGESFF